jgi:dienelactone hydrolase
MLRFLPALCCVLLVSAIRLSATAQTKSDSVARDSDAASHDRAEGGIPLGKVVDAVPCIADQAQTYALYVPSRYAATRIWPIIYVFDPEGRGKISVDLYKEVFEKYGFIVAASNNSRNFQSGATSDAARALWDDTHVRFNIDPHRVYTMGFSGGARVATALAVRCEVCAVAGVIAHGAGYPFPPSPKERFAYFAFIGNRDFNWPEIMELRRMKEDSSSAYRLKAFPGGHQWAPASIFYLALDWIQVKAMQSGTIPRDASLIDRVFAYTEKEASDAHDSHDAITEFDAFRSLVSDFSGLKDISEFQSKLDTLKNSSEFKQAMKQQQSAIDQQHALTQEISSDISRIADADTDSRLSLRNEIMDGMNSLKRRADHAKTEGERLIFKRAFSELWAQGIEAGQAEFEHSRHLANAELYFQLMAAVTPDEPWPWLLLAETAVARGDKKQANRELREAVKRGLKNPDVLDEDVNLASLRSDTEYQQLVAELKEKRESRPAD